MIANKTNSKSLVAVDGQTYRRTTPAGDFAQVPSKNPSGPIYRIHSGPETNQDMCAFCHLAISGPNRAHDTRVVPCPEVLNFLFKKVVGFWGLKGTHQPENQWKRWGRNPPPFSISGPIS